MINESEAEIDRTIAAPVARSEGAWHRSPVIFKYVRDQSAWPPHLRDDAPRQQCSGCGRFTFATSEFGQNCLMPQPDDALCSGTFGPVEA
jgi:hypothetical protein